MEREVNDRILSSPSFASFREQHREALVSGSSSPMKTFIADMLAGLILKEDEGNIHELDALRRIGINKVSGVITTNYDHLCQELFPSYNIFVGERGMLFQDPSFACETYMIHGSIEEPSSMVLTTEDYSEFDAGRDYLVAKLLTIFAEYPIVFLGYSIQDENIRSILASVARSAGSKLLDSMKARMLFIQYGEGGDNPVSTVSFSLDGHLLEMTSITTKDFLPVFEGIESSEMLYSPRVIRALRGNVFKVAECLDPKSTVVVSAFDNALSNLGEDDRVIIGFGQLHTELGQPVKTIDIYRDVVRNDMSLPPTLVVYSYLDDLLKNNSGAVPVFKYLSELGIDVNEYDKLPSRVAAYVNGHRSLDTFRSPTEKKHRVVVRNTPGFQHSVAGLINQYGLDVAYRYLLNLDEDEIDVADLGNYLERMMTDENGDVSMAILETATYKSVYRKCVRVYDFLRYGKGSSPSLG